MNIKEYRVCINDFTDETKFQEVFKTLPKYRQEKITKLEKSKDKLLSLASGYLLKNAIKEFNLNINEEDVIYNEYGKPYIKNNPIYFSISHSNDYAYLVVSDSEVGCDIEKIDERNYMSIAKRFYNEIEYKYLLESEKCKEDFFKMWTMKEAYLKCKGVGLNEKLSSFCVYINKKEINETIVLKSCIENGYAYAIVVKNRRIVL